MNRFYQIFDDLIFDKSDFFLLPEIVFLFHQSTPWVSVVQSDARAAILFNFYSATE